MFNKLKRLLFGDKRPIVSRVENQTLGPLIFAEESEDWQTTVSPPLKFVFSICGNWQSSQTSIAPDRRLIEHAESIARNQDAFIDTVLTHIRHEAAQQKHWHMYASEVAQLQINEVCLLWPDRPDDGMIMFSGPDEYRLWRCDYVDRQPVGLSFDD